MLQVQLAQDADSKSVTESLLHLHQHAAIVTSVKTWLQVLHVGIIICALGATNFLMIDVYKAVAIAFVHFADTS